jgi:hypothetical protein
LNNDGKKLVRGEVGLGGGGGDLVQWLGKRVKPRKVVRGPRVKARAAVVVESDVELEEICEKWGRFGSPDSARRRQWDKKMMYVAVKGVFFWTERVECWPELKR